LLSYLYIQLSLKFPSNRHNVVLTYIYSVVKVGLYFLWHQSL